MGLTYPLDVTGLATTNTITEDHTILNDNYGISFFIIPVYSPFFAYGLELYAINQDGSTSLLIENSDYEFVLEYLGASRSVGKPIYGAIVFRGNRKPLHIRIKYQTLGGDYTINVSDLVTKLKERVYNVRTTIWDIVTSKPNNYPPDPHKEEFNRLYGQQSLVTALGQIAEVILQKTTIELEISKLKQRIEVLEGKTP